MRQLLSIVFWLALLPSVYGFYDANLQSGSLNLTNWSGIGTNAYAIGLTNEAKAYSDSLTNGMASFATNSSNAYADSLTNGIISTATNSAKSYADTTFPTIASQLYQATNAALTALAANPNLYQATNGTLTEWATIPTNTFPNIASQLYQATNATLTALAANPNLYQATNSNLTLLQSYGPTTWQATNAALTALAGNPQLYQATNTVLTEYASIPTNSFVNKGGDTVSGPILTTSDSTNGPAGNEFVTANWTREHFSGSGTLQYNSTNVVGTAFDASTYLYVSDVQTNGSRSYTPAAGDYFGSVMTTNRFAQINGPILISAYLTSAGGAANSAYKVHPEIYYAYDTNTAVGSLLGDYESAGQTIVHGAVTNRYDWTISFPPIISTNASNFFLIRRFKVDTKVGGDTLTLTVGTNAAVVGTGSTISFTQPASAGANWVASGTTNSTLAGTATVGDAILSGGPWIDIRAYGAVIDGATENATAVQNAINALPTQGGTVWFPPGTNKISSAITLRSNMAMVFAAGSIIDATGIADSSTVFTATGSESGTVSLTADALINTSALTVAAGDEAGFSSGDYVKIGATNYFAPNTTPDASIDQKVGEICVVSSTASGTINLKTPLRDSYTTANLAIGTEMGAC